MKNILVALTFLLTTSINVAQAQVIVAEDFLYAQPTKAFGAGGGFTRQDYGGGQNGAFGQWQDRWVSVGDGIITGSDILEETFNLETDMFTAATRRGLSVNWLERDYSFSGLGDDQSVFFGVTMRSSSETALPNATFTINGAGGDSQIGMGLVEGGFRALLGVPEEGDTSGVIPGPEITDGLDPHRLIGKLEINSSGPDERLTVWLDPTDVEAAEHSVQIEADVVTGLSEFTGNLRLDHLASGGLVFWDDLALGTTWDSVVNVDIPLVTMFADTDTREVRIKNATGDDLDLTFVQLESERGLFESRWDSLAEQGIPGFQENNPTNNRFTESSFSGSYSFPDETFFDYGKVFRFRNDPDLVAHIGTDDGLLNVVNIVYGPIPEEPNPIDTDFDDNGATDLADIDALCSDVAAGSNTAGFDLTGDGVVNGDDVANFLTQTGSFPGDVNFDQEVSFADFLLLSENFNQLQATWSHGDVDCNGTVVFGDFLILSENFGAGAQGVAAVPEPSAVFICGFAFLAILTSQRRR